MGKKGVNTQMNKKTTNLSDFQHSFYIFVVMRKSIREPTRLGLRSAQLGVNTIVSSLGLIKQPLA